MTTLWNDFKYGLRMLTKSPGFAATAVLTLALGIGACTATFSLVSAVLLRPLPFREPERLVWIENLPRPEGGTPTLSGDNFVDWRTQARSFESLAAYDAFFEANSYSITGDGEPQRLRGVRVSQNFLHVLGVRPALGRGFVDEECVWNGRRAALISHALWQQRFGGATDVIGRGVTVNGESVQIVGVLPQSDNLDVLFSPGIGVDLLLPFPLTEETAQFAGRRWGNTLYAVGRLNPGVALSQAQEELAVISERLNATHPERVAQNGGLRFGARVTWLKDHIRGSFRPVFALLFGAVLCVLMIACVNISNLLLSRANGRRQEMAVRIALGAGRWRLVRQIMTESLLLAFGGGALGVFGAYCGIALIPRLQVFNIPLLQTAAMDATTAIVALALAGFAALACGTLPSLQLWRRGATEALRGAGHRGGTGKGMACIRRTLVASEIALACILLIGAALLIRSFIGILQVNLGFRPEHAVAWRVETGRPFNSLADRVAFYDRLVKRVSTVPGVDSVGLSDSLPLAFKRSWALRVKGVIYEGNAADQAVVDLVDHHYLQTLGVPLRTGRYFDDRDSAGSSQVMIINETMARNLWPGQDPIGKTAWVNSPNECTVVGVVADVRQGLEKTPEPEVYLNFCQRGYEQWHSPRLVVRSTRSLHSLIPDVRAAIKGYDPTLPSNEFMTLDQIVDREVSPRRLITGLLLCFSSFALLLAAIGLYGVIAYSVGQRTREIGIRLSFGAQSSDVLWLVVGEGLRTAGIGVVVGLTAAFFVTRVLSSQLYGVAPTDPATFTGVVVLLVAVAMLASWIPAWRAARIDPMAALRCE
jgi:putative ABC transport system permease protein